MAATPELLDQSRFSRHDFRVKARQQKIQINDSPQNFADFFLLKSAVFFAHFLRFQAFIFFLGKKKLKVNSQLIFPELESSGKNVALECIDKIRCYCCRPLFASLSKNARKKKFIMPD